MLLGRRLMSAVSSSRWSCCSIFATQHYFRILFVINLSILLCTEFIGRCEVG